MHGHLRATVKGYAARRTADLRRKMMPAGGRTGRADASGWQQLAALAERSGLPVQHGGERLVAAA